MSRDNVSAEDRSGAYWRANLRIVGVLLLVWAIAGLGCGVLAAEWLNQWKIGGFPLGFWMAQQGSIICFVILIAIYAVLLNRLDRRFEREAAASGGSKR